VARRVRYAVVGLGHIAQVAVLPAFAHARRNSELCALVSDDPRKLRVLARRFGVRHCFSYDEYDACLASGEIDAVYIALPNSLHREYSERAARGGIHVLVEKPMAVTRAECESMLETAARGAVKLMVAYRLHFEKANLEAVRLACSGRIGEPRVFSSTFAMQVRRGNIRLEPDEGAGPLHDIGIYCVNAARALFRAEPEEVFATAVEGHDSRFEGVPEAVSAVLRFPGERLATFTCSFAAADTSTYELVGTRGRLRLDPAYEYAEPLRLETVVDGKSRRRRFARRDQFAPELLHFSDCVLSGRDPQPSGTEGLVDVAIIEALLQSARERRAVALELPRPSHRPSPAQETRRPPVRKPRTVRVASAST
jgi:glucose-fructose oxidoreductase